MIVQLLSDSKNEREEIKRKQQQGIEIAKKKGHYRREDLEYLRNGKLNPISNVT